MHFPTMGSPFGRQSFTKEITLGSTSLRTASHGLAFPITVHLKHCKQYQATFAMLQKMVIGIAGHMWCAELREFKFNSCANNALCMHYTFVKTEIIMYTSDVISTIFLSQEILYCNFGKIWIQLLKQSFWIVESTRASAIPTYMLHLSYQ